MEERSGQPAPPLAFLAPGWSPGRARPQCCSTHWEAPPEGRRAFLLCSVLSRELYPTHPKINFDHASLFNTPSDSHDGQSWGAGALGGQEQVGARAGVGLPAGGDPVDHPPEDRAALFLEQGGPRFPAPVSLDPLTPNTRVLSPLFLLVLLATTTALHLHSPPSHPPFTPQSPSPPCLFLGSHDYLSFQFSANFHLTYNHQRKKGLRKLKNNNSIMFKILFC